jgi:hypothetical protein
MTVVFRLGVFSGLLLLASPAAAQATIVSYTLEVYAPGVVPPAGLPISTTTYLAGAVTCGLPKAVVPPAGVVNGTRANWEDPANPALDCSVPLAASVLTALPNAPGYRAYMTQTDNIGQTSVRSAASNPFARQGSPAVLTGVRVLP